MIISRNIMEKGAAKFYTYRETCLEITALIRNRLLKEEIG